MNNRISFLKNEIIIFRNEPQETLLRFSLNMHNSFHKIMYGKSYLMLYFDIILPTRSQQCYLKYNQTVLKQPKKNIKLFLFV